MSNFLAIFKVCLFSKIGDKHYTKAVNILVSFSKVQQLWVPRDRVGDLPLWTVRGVGVRFTTFLGGGVIFHSSNKNGMEIEHALFFYPTHFLKDERRRQILHDIPVIVLAPN